MHGPLGAPENLLELLERIEVIVIAAHVSKQRKQVVERVLVVNLSRTSGDIPSSTGVGDGTDLPCNISKNTEIEEKLSGQRRPVEI